MFEWASSSPWTLLSNIPSLFSRFVALDSIWVSFLSISANLVRIRSTFDSKDCAISESSYNSSADSPAEQSSEELEFTNDVSLTLFSSGDFESLLGKLELLLRTFLLPPLSWLSHTNLEETEQKLNSDQKHDYRLSIPRPSPLVKQLDFQQKSSGKIQASNWKNLTIAFFRTKRTNLSNC